MTAWQIVAAIAGGLTLYLAVIFLVKRLRPFPAPAFIGGFLDSKLRRRVQSPAKLMERSGVGPDMAVLDFGCGSGAFTTFLARAVGEWGAVYALDIQAAMLTRLRRKLDREENRDIRNVALVRAGAYALPFPDGLIDLVYMVAVLQEIPDRSRALREAIRVLRAGGILAVTEALPDPDYVRAAATIDVCQREGFVLELKSGGWRDYTVRLRKPERLT